MADPSWMRGPPCKILLATDMSYRCDRALERAVQVASEWNAKLLVVHAVDPVDTMHDLRTGWDIPSWRRPPDRTQAIRDRLYAELLEHPAAFEVHVGIGKPADVVLAVAERAACDLIITGITRNEPFRLNILGNTVDRLMRKSAAPLLLVHSRSRRNYRKIVVATDFSPSSRHALEAAARFFPNAAFTLLAGYSVPFAGLLDQARVPAEFRHIQVEAYNKLLKEANIDPAILSCICGVIEYGTLEALLRDYAMTQPIDLTVVGSHGGGVIYNIIIGSTARRIIDAASGDVLVVPESRAA